MSNKDSALWTLIALLAGVILLFLGGEIGGFGYGHGSYLGYGAMMGFGAIIMILFWGAIIWFVILLINTGTKKPEKTPESALTILKKRYAKGDITKEQYIEMGKDLI